MKRIFASALMAIASILLGHGELEAQQPGSLVRPTDTGARSSGEVPAALLMPQGPVVPVVADTGGCRPDCKICVSEPKPTTRKVYACKCEEYCLPHVSLLGLLRGQCSCDQSQCGDLKIRHRLVVKKVPDCDTRQCVPRAAPAVDSAGGRRFP